MINFGKALLVLATVTLAGTVLTSRGGTSAGADDAAKSATNLRCERLGGMSLKDLKARLVDNCNLDKPFSIAGMDTSMSSSFTYCCQQK